MHLNSTKIDIYLSTLLLNINTY